VNTQLRVLAAFLLKAGDDERRRIFAGLDKRVKGLLRPFLDHPEAMLHNPEAPRIAGELYRPAPKRRKT
jgi:hypothetical protein